MAAQLTWPRQCLQWVGRNKQRSATRVRSRRHRACAAASRPTPSRGNRRTCQFRHEPEGVCVALRELGCGGFMPTQSRWAWHPNGLNAKLREEIASGRKVRCVPRDASAACLLDAFVHSVQDLVGSVAVRSHHWPCCLETHGHTSPGRRPPARSGVVPDGHFRCRFSSAAAPGRPARFQSAAGFWVPPSDIDIDEARQPIGEP